jgi:murein DD-endopeptidase MepM/ murein hydrolase activator NlpD
MVSSFKFNEYAPRSLQEIYGTDFQPVQLHAVYNTLRNPVHPQSPTILIPTNPFGYRLPFLGNKTITAGPGCYHTHQGASSEAIDYSMVEDTPILAAAHGWVQWHGWATGGWGNLLRIEHWDGHVSWYAHLNSFREYMANGQYVRHGCLQAYSGNTGASTGPHLHFEVRLNNQSVWIRTLPTTVWNTGDPFNPCSSGNDGYAVGPSSPCFYPSLNSVILPAGDR